MDKDKLIYTNIAQNIEKTREFQVEKFAKDLYDATMEILYPVSRVNKYLYGKNLENIARMIYHYSVKIKKTKDIKQRIEYSLEADTLAEEYKFLVLVMQKNHCFNKIKIDKALFARDNFAVTNGGFLKKMRENYTNEKNN